MLGSILLCVYILPLGDIIRRHDIEFHLYAVDSQLLLTFNPGSFQSVLDSLEGCIAEVRLWMALNFLNLNDSITEFVVVGVKDNFFKASVKDMSIGRASSRQYQKS